MKMRFTSVDAMDAFFADEVYLVARERHFARSVSAVHELSRRSTPLATCGS